MWSEKKDQVNYIAVNCESRPRAMSHNSAGQLETCFKVLRSYLLFRFNDAKCLEML